MKEILSAIEAGRQKGCSGVYLIGDIEWYCSAAIQKHGSVYKAHVSIIKEDDMATEFYKVYFTREFSNLESAIQCVEENSPIKVSSFGALKAQKLFNPAFNEENET